MTNIPKKYQHLTVEDATHELDCAHFPGNANQPRIRYKMKCVVLDWRGDKPAKVLVFGDRYFVGRENQRRIRYVPGWKLTRLKTKKCKK